MYKLVKLFLNTLVFIMMFWLLLLGGHIISLWAEWQLNELHELGLINQKLFNAIGFRNLDYIELIKAPIAEWWEDIVSVTYPTPDRPGVGFWYNIGFFFLKIGAFFEMIWEYIKSFAHFTKPVRSIVNQTPGMSIADIMGSTVAYIVMSLSAFGSGVFVYNNKIEVYNPGSGVGVNSNINPMPGTNQRRRLPKVTIKRKKKQKDK
jgi:hypothetical protein